MSIFQVSGDELVVHDTCALQGLGGLWDDLFPVFATRFAGIDGNDSPARRVEIGVEPEHRPVIVDEIVTGIEVI